MLKGIVCENHFFGEIIMLENKGIQKNVIDYL